jgi:hypothetical protein
LGSNGEAFLACRLCSAFFAGSAPRWLRFVTDGSILLSTVIPSGCVFLCIGSFRESDESILLLFLLLLERSVPLQ